MRRSRTVKRPLACCASTAFSPPPRRIASSSARMAPSNSSRAARFAFARTEAESSADRNRLSNFETSGICTLTSTCRVPHLSGEPGPCDRCSITRRSVSRGLRLSMSGSNHGPGALAKADARQTLARRECAEGDLVAVFKKHAGLSARQLNRLRIVLHLKQAALGARAGTGDGAGGEQVAGLQIAAIARVVRDQLRNRPIEIAQISAAQHHGRCACLLHLRGLEINLEGKIDSVAICSRRAQISKRGWIAFGAFECGNAIWRQCFQRNNPGRDGCGEVLRKKRTERLVLPRLDVACRPVVDEAQAEDVLLGFGDRNRLTQRVGRTDEDAHFQFVVEPVRRSENRFCALRFDLAAWPADLSTAHDDRRSSAVIPDRNIFVIREQRIVGTKEFADARGMVDGCVEVGVVADCRRKLHGCIAHGNQQGFDAILGFTSGLLCAKERGELAAHRGPGRGAKSHERIEPIGTAGGERLLMQRGEQARLRAAIQIKDPVAYRNADAVPVSVAKNTEWKVLKGKVGARIVC
ncbi:exported hypothetical protein [Candidatus Sulfotelmatomonas gaucii]|uniref:Uncharacterized protein n=1 Tax=Candidatus Sulfuritelmatomonas gaucii TaxID=2043161 RepID=A0A2N9L3Z8_9BACT|nr:exported hypothetical protein [Candidatus Sulfotelmatomonas gaucii]